VTACYQYFGHSFGCLLRFSFYNSRITLTFFNCYCSFYFFFLKSNKKIIHGYIVFFVFMNYRISPDPDRFLALIFYN
jgi:hypothetical protein